MKQLFLVFLILTFAKSSHAQGLWFINVGAGTINYWGDLQEKSITTIGMEFAGMAGVSYQISPHFVGNFSLSFGKLGATDANNGVKWFYRNLSYKSSFFEAAFTAEYNLFDITEPEDGNSIDNNPRRFTPYIFAGVGFFNYNPYTYDISGRKVFLQPLGTEAQPTPYSLWQISLPYGIGVKYALTSTILLSGEFNLRKTFTDYLDDVSRFHYVDTTELLATHGQEAASFYLTGQMKYQVQNTSFGGIAAILRKKTAIILL